MNKARNKVSLLSQKITTFLIAALIALSSFSFFSYFVPATAVRGYETNTFRDFAQLQLPLENPQFSAAGGGVPGAPSGWTETDYPGKDKGSTAMGVLDLDIYDTQEDYVTDAKLTEYPEYKSNSPKTPFGTLIDASGINRKILMINTTEATETVIGYDSSPVTLSENGFFRISAWVKTGSFYGKHGAAVRLNGIPDQNVMFNDIVTVTPDTELTKENLFGWAQYTFYVKTSSVRAESVSLTLTVGDYYRGKDATGDTVAVNYTASGYAFFANVEAFQISPTKYNVAFNSRDEASQNIQFIDLSLPLADAGETLLDFRPSANGSFEHYAPKSSKDAGVMTADLVQPVLLDTDMTFNTSQNPYNLDYAPVSPGGKFSDDGHILVLSSFKGGKGIDANYKRTAVGYESGELTIEKLNYYRLSVWVNDHNTSGGAGATLVVTTNVEDTYDPEQTRVFRATGCNGNAGNGARYGWQEYAFYIRGSFYRDYTIKLGLWLGQEDNLTSGTAMFADARFEKLTAAQFGANSGASAGGGPVDIDSAGTETGVFNGDFSIYDDPDEEDVFPLPVSGWTFATPADISMVGYSKDVSFMDPDSIISGIMPMDDKHFWRHVDDYGPGAVRPNTTSASVLYMASSERNAFCYTSPSIGLDAFPTAAITASICVGNITGYGASLVLKDNNGIISTIEGITSTSGRFQDFTFYVQGGGSGTLTLEVWLGLNERDSYNETKLSSGNVYVDTVTLAEAERFDEKEARYQKDLNLGGFRNYAVFSYSSFNFTEFDAYDKNFVKYPYLWSVSGPSRASAAGIRSGIFDSANLSKSAGDIPPGFENYDRRDGSENLFRNNVLMLENSVKTASTVTFDRPFQLTEETYYKLEVGVKADLQAMMPYKAALAAANKATGDAEKNRLRKEAEALLPAAQKEAGAGATIALKGSDFKIENIYDTALVLDKFRDEEVFKIFTFYIYTGDEARSVQLSFSLGGAKTDEFTAGRLYVNSIAFTDITNTLFEEESAKIKRGTMDVLKADFGKQAADTAAEVDEKLPTPDAAFNWMVIPSILFSVALLLVLGAVVARRVLESLSKSHARRVASAVKAADYGRKGRGYKDFSAGASEAGGTTDSADDGVYEEFDDGTVERKKPDRAERVHYQAPEAAEAQQAQEPVATDGYESFAETDEAKEAQKPAPAPEKPKAPSSDFIDSFDD
ncbi:MAG: hypothetical protein FWD58_07715 [Firmicutes bacterium]|nr:hypothetical protein [Bacillota bacterium]